MKHWTEMYKSKEQNTSDTAYNNYNNLLTNVLIFLFFFIFSRFTHISQFNDLIVNKSTYFCLLYTSPSPRD